MLTTSSLGAFHGAQDLAQVSLGNWVQVDRFTYTFQNYFHPFVGDMITQLNQKSLSGLLDPAFQAKSTPFFTDEYALVAGNTVQVNYSDKTFDVALGGPYANYNWEILFHIPVMVAVHLTNNQRFAEAQKWFHYVFDPTSTDTGTPAPQRYWKFLAFRQEGSIADIDSLLELLSTPDSQLDTAQLQAKQATLAGYAAMLNDPFHPHAIARTRISAYQYYVVMKYLDNLIAWGDSLFLQDTIESLNEATLCYVLAANLLGPRPKPLPERNTGAARNFAQLKQAGLDPMSNAMVELEGQFPFNLQPLAGSGGSDLTGPLFGIGRTLFFCVPDNQMLLGYWDIVADRLFKIRNSENIQGIVQQLPLFDPPLDPGMLVKAAAAGIDVGSIVSGLNQPSGPARCVVMIQKALELANEVRALGGALLAAIEKGDSEQLARLRQGHDINLTQMTQNARFLQWKQAQESTISLLRARAAILERYTYYLRLLGLEPGDAAVPNLALDRRELTEDNFDDAYNALVEQYDQPIALQAYPQLQLDQSSPSSDAGASGRGQLYLNAKEAAELNDHLPTVRNARVLAGSLEQAAPILNLIPSMHLDMHFWGLGGHTKIFGGDWWAMAAHEAAELVQMFATWHQDQATIAARTAGYQRRADEWMLQANLAARELAQTGLQILASIIAEQVVYHDYQIAKTQVQQAQEVQQFLQTKFTGAELYRWMQGQTSGLYYQFYRLAVDTARKAEQTMKQELMRPEVDATGFVKFNYWDTGRQGLLSGEALYFDVKQMEIAYLENNKRELEITRHVSLRQIDPLALLSLKITGRCALSIPEWLFDRDCPGHYMRRIKSVSLSIPAVAGPYTGINCTLSLQRSTVRVSPLLRNNKYARDTAGSEDRFVDYFGSVDAIVTSGGSDDSGMFEPNLRDERLLPFEGAGVVSSWALALPAALRPFDYMTIADVILHIRYTARAGGDTLAAHATQELLAALDAAGSSGQVLMFCLRFDLPDQWYAFAAGTGDFTMQLRRDLFPYVAQSAKTITIDALTLYTAADKVVISITPAVALASLTSGINSAEGSATLTLPADATVMTRQLNQQVFVVLQYHIGM
jgi:Tc toxin complex TcA C-terminal TcB-binding domain